MLTRAGERAWIAGARAVAVGLLHTTGRRGGLAKLRLVLEGEPRRVGLLLEVGCHLLDVVITGRTAQR